MTSFEHSTKKKAGNVILNPFEALERIEASITRIESETLPMLIKRLYKLNPDISQGSEKLISKRDAARLLGCSVSTIDNLRRKGKLETVKVGKSARFRFGDLQSMIEKKEEG